MKIIRKPLSKNNTTKSVMAQHVWKEKKNTLAPLGKSSK